MPCFKGLAVSIHNPDGPLPEYAIQRNSRQGRINSYIPVPPPRIAPGKSGKLEQSSFAISITLLTPGLTVPYSTPKPTPADPYPAPQIVGSARDGFGHTKSATGPTIPPYEPTTESPNETVAAYIYFDGRQKEEVATLLRRGEETWVNSRWVGVPDAEGGGLAEREFLFREVGLERWLNGLDLQGKDAAAVVEKRRRKIEKKRRKRRGTATTPFGSDEEGPLVIPVKPKSRGGVLRYGADASSPLENLSDDDDMSSSDDEDDDDPIPESTGQIKVALFRVLASGEIKKGEYSPQFDAHDDDEDSNKNEDGGEASIDHTTSFAKPKTLDPKTISTQTVTGIDGPDRPYAVFTFLYRGEKQLQKMGILKPKKSTAAAQATPATKRRSIPADFANLKPLKAHGAAGFTGIRDGESANGRNGKLPKDDDMDSDDDDREEKFVDAPEGDEKDERLSPEEAKKRGELADGVQRIKLKRQHSFEPPPTTFVPPLDVPGAASARLPSSNSPKDSDSPPQLLPNTAFDPHAADGLRHPFGANGIKLEEDPAMIGSPLKKQRASTGAAASRSTTEALARGLGFGFVGSMGEDGTGSSGPENVPFGGPLGKPKEDDANAKQGSEAKKEAVGLGLSSAFAKPAAVKKQANEDEEL